MSDFTLFIIGLAAVLIGLQFSRFVYHIVKDSLFQMGVVGLVMITLGFVFNIPYLGMGLKIFGACLIAIAFIALIGAGVEGENEVITEDEGENEVITEDEGENEVITVGDYLSREEKLEEDEIPWGFIRTLRQNYEATHKLDKEELRDKDLPNLYKYSFLKYDDLWNEYINKLDEIDDAGGTEDEIKLKKDKLLDDYYQKYIIRYKDEKPIPQITYVDKDKNNQDEK